VELGCYGACARQEGGTPTQEEAEAVMDVGEGVLISGVMGCAALKHVFRFFCALFFFFCEVCKRSIIYDGMEIVWHLELGLVPSYTPHMP
jgi:hypothetical protein